MSSDSNIYIKTIETDSELGAFRITGTGATSLIRPNDTKPGYAVQYTSFVVGSDQLDDDDNADPVGSKDKRMLFDKNSGAFRAGRAESTQWDSASRGTNSAALGLNNIASGLNSFAAGTGNTASGNTAIALGSSNTVTTSGSVAVGYNHQANGTGTSVFMIGYGNASGSGDYSVAIGTNCESTNDNSISIGNNSYAFGTNSVSIGQHCKATGANSFAIGYGTDDNTNANTAIGTGSFAIGYKNSVSSNDSYVFGYNNTIVSGSNKAIIIGSGCSISNASASNAIVMGLNASIQHACERGLFWSGASTATDIKIMKNTYPAGSAQFDCGLNSTFAITFDGGTVSSALSGQTGYSWNYTSDINLKENLVERDYSDTLTRIMDMPIYTYNFKTVDPGIKSIGPVAQDFNRLFPSDKDQLSIVERDMCGVALAGVKGVKLGLDSLSENVDSRLTSNSETTSVLQSRIAVLESSLVSASTQIAAMESRLAALEAP